MTHAQKHSLNVHTDVFRELEVCEFVHLRRRLA